MEKLIRNITKVIKNDYKMPRSEITEETVEVEFNIHSSWYKCTQTVNPFGLTLTNHSDLMATPPRWIVLFDPPKLQLCRVSIVYLIEVP